MDDKYIFADRLCETININNRSARRILQITLHSFPPEIRVVKEGISLCEAGFTSAVLCPPIPNRPEREKWNGIQIFRPKELAKARGVLDKLLFQILFFSPSWYRAIRETIAEYRPHVLHIHDIWLGRTVFAACSGQKLVMDLHENMPAAVAEYLKGYRGATKCFNGLFRNHGRVFRYERALLSRSDRIFTVVEEARKRVLVNHPAIAPEKVVNIENLESKRFIAQTDVGKAVFLKDHFSILYIGGFAPHRGIETLIRAMVFIKRWRLNIRVQLVGAQPSQYLDMLMALILKLGVDEHVCVSGWVPAESVLANIRQADVGCVPHDSNSHTNNTIPHKLFQYMIAQTPVLVSTSVPIARTVRQSNAGQVFLSGNAEDCAKKIREMYNDRDALKTYAENGFRYVMEKGHNWEEESALRLVHAYDELLNCGLQVVDPFEVRS